MSKLPTLQELERAIKVVKLLEITDPYSFVEPCVEDCNDARHAYHQGQWDMAVRIEKFIEDTSND